MGRARLFGLVMGAVTLLAAGAGLRASDGAGPGLGPGAGAGPRFAVSFPTIVREEPASGRLVVYLVRDGSSIHERRPPGSGPFFDDPQPMFGIDVEDLEPGQSVIVDDAAAAFPMPLSRLAPGTYRVQAVLDMNRSNSNWRREAGNLYSQVTRFTIDPAKPFTEPVAITLSDRVFEPVVRPMQGVEVVDVVSESLSAFRENEVHLRAGVVLPENYDPGRAYAAVYVIPGFGGDERMAFSEANVRFATSKRDVPHRDLWSNAFIIVLNPESGNGHTLFADSDNNGPVAAALIRELIPALEARYPLIKEPSARLVTGHSSGAWSALWLSLNHPETFGGCWASAPDPVDFRSFQLINLYEASNWYEFDEHQNVEELTTGVGALPVRGEVPSYRDGAKIRMTVRQENAMEEVIGPGNSSGQQWDSWMAVFGPRGDDGNPAALYHPVTGAINPAIIEHFQRYDIGRLLRSDPERYGRILRQNVRLLVGGKDNYFLDGAVRRLAADLERLAPAETIGHGPGSITIVPDADHNTLLSTPEADNWVVEMVNHLRAAGHIRD